MGYHPLLCPPPTGDTPAPCNVGNRHRGDDGAQKRRSTSVTPFVITGPGSTVYTSVFSVRSGTLCDDGLAVKQRRKVSREQDRYHGSGIVQEVWRMMVTT